MKDFFDKLAELENIGGVQRAERITKLIEKSGYTLFELDSHVDKYPSGWILRHYRNRQDLVVPLRGSKND